MKRCILMLSVAAALNAQPVVAPTSNDSSSTRGENVGNYNITNSFEAGYRFATVGGNYGMYRGNVNYGNGVRLFNGSLTINSRDGHGTYFDEFTLQTFGLGNDPYEGTFLRVQKNGLYRYDGAWRLSKYFNPALVTSDGQHIMDTQRQLQDHDFTLLPQSRIRFRAGYSRNSENGPALTTEQGLTAGQNSSLLFANVRRDYNEYRGGVDVVLAGFKLTLTRQWSYYKDDSIATSDPVSAALLPIGVAWAPNVYRTSPYHGSTPGWFGNLNTTRKQLAMNARMTYLMGNRNFLVAETAPGFGRPGAAPTLMQTVASGTARRPYLAGDFSLSWFPTEKLTVVTNSSASSNRTDGAASMTVLGVGTPRPATVDFQYLGIRNASASADVTYRVNKWLGLFSGYQYSSRLIKTVEASGFRDSAEQENHQNAGTLGVRLRPLKPLTISVDGEVGRNNHPFAPISERSYHTLGGRVDYRLSKLRLGAAYSQVYNINSPSSLTVNSSHSRKYSATAFWNPREWVAVSADYVKLHLDTLSSLAYFAGGGNRQPLYRDYSSLYLSNMHMGHVDARFRFNKRASMNAGYTLTKDAGDGRATAGQATGGGIAVYAPFAAVQTFPLGYHAPMMRLNVRVNKHAEWHAGWQYYAYHQDFVVVGNQPNYRAHTGYTSVSWTF